MAAAALDELSVTMPSDREILVTRAFDASRELVFEATTKPEHMARWWGPRHLTMPVCEIDLRPGGAYRIVSRDPEGKEHPFRGVYREVAPPERLVFTQAYDVEPWADQEMVVTITLDDRDGKTRLTGLMTYPSPEGRDADLSMGMEAGMRESYDRLAELLRELQ